MRNERIRTTMRICNLSEMLYHLVTRSEQQMAIFEEPMDLVDIDKIKLTSQNKTNLHFTDQIHDYSFSLSKSTLLKKFDTSDSKKILEFRVEILENPYDFLLSNKHKNLESDINKITSIKQDFIDFIILPLYSKKNNQVEERSGLNQWNANGRARNEDEVYIAIPSWIHKNKKGFFEYNTDDHKTAPFDVKLPNGKILSMKVAQQGGKALMSNPNAELGKWLLRDILKLEKGVLVTKEQLDIIGIDSVKLSKIKNGSYYLDFLRTGSFEEFEETYRKG